MNRRFNIVSRVYRPLRMLSVSFTTTLKRALGAYAYCLPRSLVDKKV